MVQTNWLTMRVCAGHDKRGAAVLPAVDLACGRPQGPILVGQPTFRRHVRSLEVAMLHVCTRRQARKRHDGRHPNMSSWEDENALITTSTKPLTSPVPSVTKRRRFSGRMRSTAKLASPGAAVRRRGGSLPIVRIGYDGF